MKYNVICPSCHTLLTWKEWVKHMEAKVCAYGQAKTIGIKL